MEIINEGSLSYDVHMTLAYLKWAYNKLYTIYEDSYDRIYPWTNESLSTYYDLYNLENKDILTVTSSLDHALHAILMNAKKIDSFDKNKLCKYYAELKISLIKTLEYEEFMKFYYDKSFFENLDINTLSYNLSDKAKDFWLEFYDNSKPNKRYKIFKSDGYIKQTKNDIKYLDKDYYYKLKNNIYNANIKYYDSNIENLNTKKTYDVIFLSNILDFYNINGRKNILNKCFNMLNDNGIIYSYNKLTLFSKTETDNLKVDRKILTKKLPNNKYESVLIYKKI